MSTARWFASFDWWGNALYLVGSFGYAFMDFVSGFASGDPLPSFIAAETVKALWLLMASLFLVDAIIYWLAWYNYAHKEATFKSEPVRSAGLLARVSLTSGLAYPPACLFFC